MAPNHSFVLCMYVGLELLGQLGNKFGLVNTTRMGRDPKRRKGKEEGEGGGRRGSWRVPRKCTRFRFGSSLVRSLGQRDTEQFTEYIILYIINHYYIKRLESTEQWVQLVFVPPFFSLCSILLGTVLCSSPQSRRLRLRVDPARLNRVRQHTSAKTLLVKLLETLWACSPVNLSRVTLLG